MFGHHEGRRALPVVSCFNGMMLKMSSAASGASRGENLRTHCVATCAWLGKQGVGTTDETAP